VGFAKNDITPPVWVTAGEANKDVVWSRKRFFMDKGLVVCWMIADVDANISGSLLIKGSLAIPAVVMKMDGIRLYHVGYELISTQLILKPILQVPVVGPVSVLRIINPSFAARTIGASSGSVGAYNLVTPSDCVSATVPIT